MRQNLVFPVLICVVLGWHSSPQAGVLELLLARAVEQSPEVAKAQASLEAMLAEVQINASRWYPQINAKMSQGVSDTRQSNPALSRNANNGDKVESNSITLQQNIYNKPQSIQDEQTGIALDIARARLEQARQLALQNWVLKYLDYRLANQKLILIRTRTDTAALQLEQTRSALAGGESSQLDVDSALNDLDLASAEQLNLQNEVEQRAWEMSELTGQPLDIALLNDIALGLPTETEDWPSPDSLQLNNNLDLKILALNTDLGRLEIDKNFAAHHPTFKVVAQNTQSLSDSVSTLGNRVQQQLLALQVDIPLFSGFGIQETAKKATAEQRAQVAELSLRQLTLRGELRNALKQWDIAVQTLPVYRQALERINQQCRAIETGVTVGLYSRVDVAKARERWVELSTRLFDRTVAAQKAYVNILALNGGLTVDHACQAVQGKVHPNHSQ